LIFGEQRRVLFSRHDLNSNEVPQHRDLVEADALNALDACVHTPVMMPKEADTGTHTLQQIG
jgi:hypothetical protein